MESREDEAVRAAVVRFYDALDDLIHGKGLATMEQAWHHTDRVTTAHPLGEWSHGWDEVCASWQAIAAVGSETIGRPVLLDLRVHRYGDVAYSTAVFVAPPEFGGATLNVTNVLHCDDGVWKLVHHHADKAPSVEAGLTKMAES